MIWLFVGNRIVAVVLAAAIVAAVVDVVMGSVEVAPVEFARYGLDIGFDAL